LSALRHREFRLLFGGWMAGGIGQWMQQYAVGWFVVQIAVSEGNPALGGFYLGLTSLAGAFPALAFGLFAGVFADRMDRRDLLVRARVASSMVAIALALLVITDRAGLAAVMALSAAAAAAFAFDPPGRLAMLPNVIPPRDLFNAMGLARTSNQASHILAPLIAGLLILPMGIGGVLLTKALLDLASVGALLYMRPHPAAPGARAFGVLDSLKEGLNHIVRNVLIREAMAVWVVVALLLGSLTQLLPALAVESLAVGAIELSWLLASLSAGSLVGAVLVANSGDVSRRGLLLLGALLLAGLMLAALGLQRSVVGALLVLIGLGMLQSSFVGILTVILQMAAPDRLRGRILGLQAVIYTTGAPFGVLAVGTLGMLIGISNAFVVAGALVAAVGIFAWARLGALRDLRAGGTHATDVLLQP
jgi:MFS family permease